MLKYKKIISFVLCLVLSLSATSFKIVQASSLSKNTKELNFISKNIKTGKTAQKKLDQRSLGFNSLMPKSTNSYIPSYMKQKINSSKIIVPNVIIGSDDRERVNNSNLFPYSAIAYIRITFPNGDVALGTAWMYGPNLAVTAGHCVYDANEGGWATNIEVYPGKDQSYEPFGSSEVVTESAANGWINNEDSDYDWAALQLDTNIGNSTGYFGAYSTDSSLTGINVELAGYPGEYDAQMWTMWNSITDSSTYKVRYTIDTTAGQSGSPVFIDSNENYQVLAIHTDGVDGQYNEDTRIAKYIFDYLGTLR